MGKLELFFGGVARRPGSLLLAPRFLVVWRQQTEGTTFLLVHRLLRNPYPLAVGFVSLVL
jgi:hypothetical protein